MSWRDTLFVWSGSLLQQSSGIVIWRGTWVGIDSSDAKNAAVPAKSFFASSEMHFAVSAERDLNSQELNFVGGSGWDLDDGNGINKYQDCTHNVRFTASSFSTSPSVVTWLLPRTRDVNTTELAFACGRNAFGHFISIGVACRGPSGVMTMARRYLADEDDRCAWTTEDLARRIGRNPEGIPPWQCEIMHSAPMRKDSLRPGKRSAQRQARPGKKQRQR
jgi:hypothetical protein